MAARKTRVRVAFDTNVFVRSFKTRRKSSPNRRAVRLWLLEKRLQLVVSAEIVAEYLEIFATVLGMDAPTVDQWQIRFTEDARSTLVHLGRRYTESRDPDDNLMLATARAGRAKYLITNDRDLLDLPDSFQRTQPFPILTPGQFLQEVEGEE